MSLATTSRARLVADATLVALLDTYRGQPAVIVADDGTVPEDMPRRFVVVIADLPTDEPNDTKDKDGRDQTLMVRTYDKATGSTKGIDAVAERIRFLFHRKPAGLAPGAYVATCSGPFSAPTDSALYGRQVEVRVQSQAS